MEQPVRPTAPFMLDSVKPRVIERLRERLAGHNPEQSPWVLVLARDLRSLLEPAPAPASAETLEQLIERIDNTCRILCVANDETCRARYPGQPATWCVNCRAADALRRLQSTEQALQKIDAIRNDIVGRQTIGWSAHVYPLVAALGEAGYKGEGYDVAREKAETLVRALEKAEARAEAAEQKLREQEKGTR